MAESDRNRLERARELAQRQDQKLEDERHRIHRQMEREVLERLRKAGDDAEPIPADPAEEKIGPG